MSRIRTDEQCKDIIRLIAGKLNIEAKLITTELLSEDDKEDLRNGNLPLESLECFVKLWIESRNNGSTEREQLKRIII